MEALLVGHGESWGKLVMLLKKVKEKTYTHWPLESVCVYIRLTNIKFKVLKSI